MQDGDSVYVPELPAGVIAEAIDTSLMLCVCAQCRRASYVVEYCFSSAPNPADEPFFCTDNLPQTPDEVRSYRADAADWGHWKVQRFFFDTGKCASGRPHLPKGAFVVDRHCFGPFALRHRDDLVGSKMNGVTRRSGHPLWDQQERFFLGFAPLGVAAVQQAHRDRQAR